MAKVTLDGAEIEAPDGAPLVEVIKRQGIFISNLCYIDGLPPYAGCRTCLVEIEGARGLQLSCSSRVVEGMVVRTDTAAAKEARQAVLSIINANHSDRCLTCHRRVHCMPGDICLRDDNVTHRCLTCAKNYRCELQTTNEMLDMANYEPWLGEERTYYESEQPEADRANPFLEFDPQMCIICTRCVRACDEIRHTGAITLAGRGFSTRIAFGAGGAIHDSDCDFCGACIDVCPTATLLEKPNKWIAKSEEWVSTTCNSCSVGCTLSMAVRNGRVVMVKPEQLNPVSWDQICVRGRFHYDAVKPRDRLTRHRVRQGDALTLTTFEGAVDAAATGLADVIGAHGPSAVGFLVGPWATNEEAFLAQRLARSVVGTESVDSTAGPVAAAVEEALDGAFAGHALSADLSEIATASTVVVIADDLESSHNVAALRVKDAVVGNGARLIVVSSRYGEVCDFVEAPPAGAIMPSPQRVATGDRSGVWLRPRPGGETATVAALGRRLADVLPAPPAGASGLRPAEAPGVDEGDVAKATAILREAAAADGKIAIIYAPNPAAPNRARETAKAAANLAILCRGDEAARSLHVLATEANVNGGRDLGVRPGPGGLGLEAMLAGGVRALVVVGDNPLMHGRDADTVRAALAGFDCLIVIDSLQTETADLAHVAFADLPAYGKEGSFTSADRRLLRLTRAESATGDQRDCLETLTALATALGGRLGKDASLPAGAAAAVMAELSATVPGYEGGGAFESGGTRALTQGDGQARLQPVEPETTATANDELILTTGRTLYTSLEGAALRSAEADKLHREEFLELNPADAATRGIGQNRPVVVTKGAQELTLSAALTDAVAPGSVFLPLYYEGGIVNRLLDADGTAAVSVRPA